MLDPQEPPPCPRLLKNTRPGHRIDATIDVTPMHRLTDLTGARIADRACSTVAMVEALEPPDRCQRHAPPAGRMFRSRGSGNPDWRIHAERCEKALPNLPGEPFSSVR